MWPLLSTLFLYLLFLSPTYSVLKAQIILDSTQTVDTTAIYFVELETDIQLFGRITAQEQNQISFYDFTLGEVHFSMKKMLSKEKIQLNKIAYITLSDGKVLIGKIIGTANDQLLLETELLGQVSLAYSKIKYINILSEYDKLDGKFVFHNPQPTRYFFFQNAIPMKKKECYYQNIYLAYNSIQYAYSDHFSVGFSAAALFFFTVNTKWAYKVHRNIYAATGFYAGVPLINVSSLRYGLLAYGTLTVGNDNNNVSAGINYGTLGMMKPAFYGSGGKYYPSRLMNENTEKPIISLHGMYRISQRFALISENYLFPINNNTDRMKYTPIISYGLRVMSEKNVFDVLFVNNTATTDIFFIGIPLIDFVHKF